MLIKSLDVIMGLLLLIFEVFYIDVDAYMMYFNGALHKYLMIYNTVFIRNIHVFFIDVQYNY